MSAVMAQPQQAEIEFTRQAEGQAHVLTPGALRLLVGLHRRFEPIRQARLEARRERQAFFDDGGLPDFRPDTKAIRDGDWRVAPLPKALLDRRVEITGPVDPKMVINALNSGAKVYMADFEDSTAPTWDNLIAGQRALIEAVRGTLEFTAGRDRQALRPATVPGAGRADGPPAWLAPGREAPAHRRRADLGQPVRPGAVRLPQRRTCSPRRTADPTSTCPSCSRWKRRSCGTTCSTTSSANWAWPRASSRSRC